MPQSQSFGLYESTPRGRQDIGEIYANLGIYVDAERLNFEHRRAYANKDIRLSLNRLAAAQEQKYALHMRIVDTFLSAWGVRRRQNPVVVSRSQQLLAFAWLALGAEVGMIRAVALRRGRGANRVLCADRSAGFCLILHEHWDHHRYMFAYLQQLLVGDVLGAEDEADLCAALSRMLNLITTADFKAEDVIELLNCAERRIPADTPASDRSDVLPFELAQLLCSQISNNSATLFLPQIGYGALVFADVAHRKCEGEESSIYSYRYLTIKMLIAGLSAKVASRYVEGATYAPLLKEAIVACTVGSNELGLKLLQNFGSVAADQAEMALVVESRILYDDAFAGLRSQLLADNMVEMTALLPSNLLSPSDSLCLIKLQKGRKPKASIRLIDARSCVIDLPLQKNSQLDLTAIYRLLNSEESELLSVVSIDDIKAHNVSLIQETYRPVRTPFAEAEVTDVLSSIIKIRNAYLPSESVVEYIKAANLPESPFASVCASKSEEPVDCLKLTCPAILIPRQGHLNAHFVEASDEEPLFIADDIFVGILRGPEFEPDFVAMEIAKSTLPQLEATDLYSESAVLALQVRKLPFDEQERLCMEAKSVYINMSGETDRLKEEIARMKHIYFLEISNIVHDMSHVSESINSSAAMLREQLPDASQECREFVLERYRSIKQALTRLSTNMDILSKEDLFSKCSRLNLVKVIQEILPLMNTDGTRYQIRPVRIDSNSLVQAGLIPASQADSEQTPALYAMISKNQMFQLVENIFNNARKHGFSDGRDDYYIQITIGAVNGMYQIDFTNNGAPFPTGLTREKYIARGVSEGERHGNGLGGNIVFRVVEYFNGDIDILSDSQEVTIRVLIPIAE